MIRRRALGALDLQKAVFMMLRRQMPTAAVYDSVPDSGQFPYVALGDDTLIDWSGKDDAGIDASVTVQVFSRALGFSEAKGLAGDVVLALTSAPLNVSGFRTVTQDLDGTESFRDGEDRRVVVRFKLKLQEL